MAHTYSGEEDVEVMPIEQQELAKYIFVTMVDTVTGRIYTNQIGAFPLVSSQVNCYVFIIYDYKSNAILVDQMKSIKGG